MKGEVYGMGYDWDSQVELDDDEHDMVAQPIAPETWRRPVRQPVQCVEDRGEKMLRDLDQEAVALREALARNALARGQVAKQQEQKLALGEDIFHEGDVVRWRKQFRDRTSGNLSETVYTYAAVKLPDGQWPDGQWAVTGTTQKRMSWKGLCAFMIARGIVLEAHVMRVDRTLV